MALARFAKVSFSTIEEISRLTYMLIGLGSKLENIVYGIDSKDLRDLVRDYRHIVARLSDIVTSMRLVPLAPVFRHIVKVGRSIAEDLGKKVAFRLVGENIKVDRRLAEVLPDILVHLVRNALDHGIESPDIRRMKGKPEEGLVVVGARQEGNYVVVFVEDDGAGIDVDKVKKRALEKGLIRPEDVDRLTWEDIVKILTTPGFSTKSGVTKYSGRGVGLDAVKEFAESYGGFLEIVSEKDRGTRVSIYIPYKTIALKLLVFRADQCFAVPVDYVVRVVHASDVEVYENYIVFKNKYFHRILIVENVDINYFILMHRDGLDVAIGVEDVEGQQVLAVVPAPRTVGSKRIVSGIALRGEEICFLIDVVAVAKTSMCTAQRRVADYRT